MSFAGKMTVDVCSVVLVLVFENLALVRWGYELQRLSTFGSGVPKSKLGILSEATQEI
jgi:hypothetical protein